MNSKTIKRFLKRKSSVVGLIIIIIFILLALIGPLVIKTDPNVIDPINKYQSPSKEHIFGTDNLGRDTFTRIVYGARITLLISFTSVISGSLIGIIFGMIAGYYGGAIDAIIMRTTDILLAFPGLLLAIAIVAILGSGIINTIMAISIFSIPYIARIVRGTVITIRDTEYIQACKVIGCSDFAIITKHIFPNSLSQIIVNVTLRLGTAILTSSALSYLGLGVQPPDPEWGAMLTKAKEVMRTAPIAALVPGIAITLVVMSFSLLGDGLRDALDPRLKNR